MGKYDSIRHLWVDDAGVANPTAAGTKASLQPVCDVGVSPFLLFPAPIDAPTSKPALLVELLRSPFSQTVYRRPIPAFEKEGGLSFWTFDIPILK